tara:strand:- start:16603 stop:16887 length:285 start_codon:yes stop_codon:yes gene_type:complete
MSEEEVSMQLLVEIRHRLEQEQGTWQQFSATLMACGEKKINACEASDGLTVILSRHPDLLLRMSKFYPLNKRIKRSDLFVSKADIQWSNSYLSA